jgi:hypothetical protein
MQWLFSALITGAIAFSATNLDDILFLTFFFQTAHKWHVVVGQYLGFSALMLVSLIGFFGGRALPHEWIRWTQQDARSRARVSRSRCQLDRKRESRHRVNSCCVSRGPLHDPACHTSCKAKKLG